jgi:aminotransferase
MQSIQPIERRLSDRVKAVPPSGIRRFFDIAATMDDVVTLGIGEPDFVSPPPVIDAAIASLKEGKTGYTSNAGLIELREVICQDLLKRYNVTYDAGSEVIVSVGVSEALQLTMLALLDPGDEILIPEPCFVSYAPTAIFAGGTVVHVPTSVDNQFQVTAEDIEPFVTPRSKILFLGYPNNPTGAVLRRETLEGIADLVAKYDLLVISDEIYDRLVYGDAYENGHTCLPSIPSLRDRTVLLGGFSKNYAMTGWRVGYACAPSSILSAMYKIHQYMIMSAPTVGQYGALAALQECQVDVERMRQAYDARRRLLVDGLRAAGLPTFEPEGAFYAFPDISSTGLSSDDFAERLIEEERVAVVPGDAFGPSGAGFVRCAYANSLDNIQLAVDRITRFVGRYQTGRTDA